MTVPARYTLTEAHFRIAELEGRLAEQDTEIQRLREERDEKGRAYGEEALAHNETLERAEAAEAKNEKLSKLIMEQEAEYRREKRAAEAENRRLTEGLRDSRLLDSLINAVTSHWQEQPGTRGRIVDPDGLRDTLRALLAGSEAEPDEGGEA